MQITDSRFLLFLQGNLHHRINGPEQYLPEYLSKYGQVYCVEYPRFTKMASLLFRHLHYTEQTSSNITVYHSFGITPFARSYYILNEINYRINFHLSDIKDLNKNNDFIIISFTPEVFFYIKQFKSKAQVFYYVIDEFKATPFWHSHLQARQLKKLEKLLIPHLTGIIATSSTLFNKYISAHKNVIYFPSPTQSRNFRNNIGDQSVPADPKEINHPIVGFMGGLYDWKIDIKLLLWITKSLPNYHLYFLEPGNCVQLTMLLHYYPVLTSITWDINGM